MKEPINADHLAEIQMSQIQKDKIPNLKTIYLANL